MEPSVEQQQPSESQPNQAQPQNQQVSTWPILSYMEEDRFCGKCGYNLMRQPVRQDPHLDLQVTQCPECGSFEPANQIGTLGERLLNRLSHVSILIAAVALLTLISFEIAIGSILVGIQSSVAMEVVLYNHDFGGFFAFTLILSLLAFATGLLFGCLFSLLFPHWTNGRHAFWGVIRLALITIFPLSLGLLAAQYDNEASLFLLSLLWILICAVCGNLLISVGSGAVGRGLARFFLSDRGTRIVSVLWTKDGLTPPYAKKPSE